ncbi:leucine-rich repeat protein [Bacteroides stercorirosoris]|uniref:leucine-rich repeat protein n=1 Tax=Bacteroides stercorirosoris TaxID=871324 RepID=UPI000A751611|nr:leucine-rich repeat protein [Bacteroides stercorirosoris]
MDKTAVNALNVSSTGWDSEVTTGEPPTTDGEVTVVPSTAGSLTLPTNLSGTDNKLMITGQIDGEDLKTLSKSMDKFSELYINATLSGTTALPEEFAKNMANLKVITLPKGMTRIENYAFRGCAALTSISLPEGVTEHRKLDIQRLHRPDKHQPAGKADEHRKRGIQKLHRPY